MGKIKILITDPIDETGIKMMIEEGYEVRQEKDLNKNDLLTIIADYDAIVCRSSTIIDRDIIVAANKLKCIAITSTGWDTIDLNAANEYNIAVFGQPTFVGSGEDISRSGSFVPTAEHAMLLMLAAAGDFYNTVNSIKNGYWSKFDFSGTELLDKTVGIVGFGRIGQLVARRAHAFGMKVIAYDKVNNYSVSLDFPVHFVDLDQLCQQSDFITIHMPKTTETVNLIASRQFELMKEEAVIINTSRGGIINERDLLEALKNKKIRAAALDVFVNEGLDLNMELISLPNVLATPHIAGVSKEGQKRRSVATAYNIINFLKHNDLTCLINDYKKNK